MKNRDAQRLIEDRRQILLTGLQDALPAMQQRALVLDRQPAFPAQDFALLRGLGALAAPIPMALGGLGLGTAPSGALALADILRLLGRGSLSAGRLYEAHVNALRMVVRFGSEAQARSVAEDALAGHVFGLWVTDLAAAPLQCLADGRLHGTKFPCSGAGHVTRALVTANMASGEAAMFLVAVEHAAVDVSRWDAHGMRASVSGCVDLTGLPAGAPVGLPRDYLRQPDFSAGAWRGSAVSLGGLEALVWEFRAQLAARGRDGDAHQRARVGQALIAQETARLWVRRAALLGEASEGDANDIANTVNLARIAVEAACLDAIRLVQRGLGMAGFRQGTLTELLFRDLSFYLRQPAPDETLTEAAAHFMRRDLPALA
jgi:alkylation response protein AidB-like acyl-CoA dehydrogenase